MRKAKRIKDKKPPLEKVVTDKGAVYYNAYKRKSADPNEHLSHKKRKSNQTSLLLKLNLPKS